jgi:hypothetical protein
MPYGCPLAYPGRSKSLSIPGGWCFTYVDTCLQPLDMVEHNALSVTALEHHLLEQGRSLGIVGASGERLVDHSVGT